MPRLPKGGSVTALPAEVVRRHQRNELAIRFFEVLITRSDKFDIFQIRAPMQAALCAKNCADVLLAVLDEQEAA